MGDNGTFTRLNDPDASDASHVETELPALITMTVYMVFVDVTGLIGNLLVIVSVAMSPRLRTTSFAFVINLSVADLMVSILVIPLLIKSFFNYGWPHDPLGCRLVCYIFLFSIGSSLITLAAIAASRYCFVSRSRQAYNHFCSSKSVAVVLIFNWLSAVTLVLVSELASICTIRYQSPIRFCYLDDNDPATFWYTNAILIYGIFMCFFLIPLLYYRTFRAVQKSKQRVWAARQAPVPAAAPIVHPAEIRLTKMMLLIFILLTGCWMPITILHFLKHTFTIPQALQQLAIMLVLTNSSINPYIYAWYNKHFRHAYKRILHLNHCM